MISRALPVTFHFALLKALGLLLCLALAVLAVPANAQSLLSAVDAREASAQIAGAERELKAVDQALDGGPDEKAQEALQARARAAGDMAKALVAKLEPQLLLIDARVQELGPVAQGAPAELRVQRRALLAEHAAIDAAIRRGRLVTVEAQQLADEIDRSRAEQFSAEITTRVTSPLAPAFWSAVIKAFPRDSRRISLFLSQGATQVRQQWRGGVPWPALLGVALGFLLLFPCRIAAKRAAQRYLIEGAPGHRLRRSANAVQRVAVDTVAPMVAAIVTVGGLRWSGLLPARWDDMLDAVIAAAGFGGFTVAVTGTVLMASQPSWRLAPIDDRTAAALRPLTWLLAALSIFAILLRAFNTSVGASRAAMIAADGVTTILTLALLVTTLVVLARVRAARIADKPGVETSAGLSLIGLVAWIIGLVTLVAVLAGYIGLGAFLMGLVTWGVVLGCALYLLARAIDDVCSTVLSRNSAFGRGVTRALGVRPSVVDQIGLIVSGVLRLTLLVVGVGLLFTPFGASGGVGTLFGRLGTLAQGVEIAGIAISPGAILRGVIVLAVGLAIVRAFMGWLEGRYLPATELDGSARNSVSLVARYVGIALAVIWALASLGIGVERIALLLSALSVGIGFGLQAITQNFVSGLILLAERPIKIGDLIKVGNDEGDVKRISVRSTEIALADHSTLIVPNSELITKSVVNKTRASPLGRVQIQFSVPLGADVQQVRQIVLEAFAAEEAILDDPAPAVFIDTITADRIMFNCIAQTSSPRNAYGARSGVLMSLLSRFHQEGVEIGTPPQKLELRAPSTEASSDPDEAIAARARSAPPDK